MSRGRRSLTPPPDRLEHFPRHRLLARRALWRIHRADRGAWGFSSSGHGRFDLPAPTGTCYAAEDALGSFIEVFRCAMPVVEEEILSRRLSHLHVPRALWLADCRHPQARRYGVTGEIHTTDDFVLTQTWARALHGAGFAGIRYLLRHDPSQRRVGVALFGSNAAVASQPRPETLPIGQALIVEARQRYGVVVLPTP